MAWKRAGDEVLLYAFSQKSGSPIPDVQLARYDADTSRIGEELRTDGFGLATVPLKDAKWLIASSSGDVHGMRFDSSLPEVYMWQFGVPVEWRSVDRGYREIHMFTERPLYKPGETVHLKCQTRMVQGTKVTLPGNRAATLRGFDAQGRKFLEQEVTFSERGSYSGSFELPGKESGLGAYRFRVSFVDKKGGGSDENVTREKTHYVFVQEFKANTFAVSMSSEDSVADSDRHRFPLSANYLMGKPLSKAKVTWSASVSDSHFYHEDWEEYAFFDNRDRWIYDGDGNYREFEEVVARKTTHSFSGDTALNDRGQAEIEIVTPTKESFPSRRTVHVSASVTDINQQTISANTSKTLESSDFYLGIRRVDRVMRVGSASELQFAAVIPEGSSYQSTVKAEVVVEKLKWNSLKVEAAGGAITTKNFVSSSELGKAITHTVTRGDVNDHVVAGVSGHVCCQGDGDRRERSPRFLGGICDSLWRR